MKTFARLVQGGAICAALMAAAPAYAVTINSFQFNGALEVEAADGLNPAEISILSNFNILSQNGAGAGDLIGLTGQISGLYTFDDPAGATTVLLTSPTAPNTFSIFDGVDTFTAEIDLIELDGGTAGTIFGTIDFGTSSYAGSNAALLDLNTLIQDGLNLTITFQTRGGSGVDLDELFEEGSEGIATYSAAVRIARQPVNVAEPAPLALLGFGLLASAGWIRRRRQVSQAAQNG